jgi:hypothetical protein
VQERKTRVVIRSRQHARQAISCIFDVVEGKDRGCAFFF